MNEPFNSSFEPQILICEDLTELSNRAADFIQSLINENLFRLVLAGGSTPKALYKILSERGLDWRNGCFFWGDERCVPPDHPDSNFRMARESLLENISVEPDHIHRMKGETEPAAAALEYERVLRKNFSGDENPSFDLVLLGMGEDGHTASLFPGTAALEAQDRWVVENYVEKLQAMRLTMTFPLLNQAKRIMFLVSGVSKATALHQVLEGKFDPFQHPSQGIRPVHGELFYIVDEAAASLLNKR